MALRILLMGLVASMGFELPGGPEASAWAGPAHDQACARPADPPGPTDCLLADVSEAIEPAAIVEEATGPADAAFLAASEATAAAFLADSKSVRDEESPGEDVPSMLASEAPPVGLPVGEELAVDESGGEGGATAEVEQRPTRAERVISAIRRTHEAVQAWSELIQESADEACLTR